MMKNERSERDTLISATGVGVDFSRLHNPGIPSDFVERSVLFDRLDEGVQKALTLVCAGAGFGKSTLVSGWLKKSAYSFAWVSLQEDHAEPRNFFAHLIAAVQQVEPGFGEGILPLLQISPLPPIHYLSVELKNELGKLPSPFVLVLDDLHLINTASVFEFLQVLLEPPLKSLHLCIISRKRPSFRLSKLWSRGEISEIGSDQLRMTREEMDIFFGGSVGSEVCSVMQERLEGWVAGLRLFKLRISQGRGVEGSLNMEGGTESLFDAYFMEEILEGFSADCLGSLLRISILSQFHPRLVDALVGNSEAGGCDGRVMVEYLLNENLFVVVLDAKNQWYRFHHLFHELLRKELEKVVSPEIEKQLHERAARWYGKQGMIEEALSHAGKAGIVDWAASLVAEQFFKVLEEDNDYILESWLVQLPEGAIQKKPMLEIARMWVLKDREAFHLLPELLESLLKKSPELDGELQAYVLFFQGIVQFWGGLIEPSVQSFRKTLTLLSAPKHSGILGETQVYYATAMQMLGKGDGVEAEIEKRLLCENVPASYRLKLVGALLFRNMFAGNMGKSFFLGNRLKRLCEESNNLFVLTWTNYVLGNIHLRQNRFEEAQGFFSSALKKRYMMDLSSPADCFSAQLLALQAKGDAEGFQSVLRDFKEFVQEQNNALFRMWFFSVQTRLALQQKDFSRAERFFQQVEFSGDTHNFLFWIENPRITYCRLLISRNTTQSLEEATGLLLGYLENAKATHHVLLEVEVRILLAILEKEKKQESTALEHLELAIKLAAPSDLFYLFTEVGDELEPLFLKTDPKFQSLEFFKELQRQIHPARLPQVSEKLTNREMDVLSLFEQRLTNQEVADELCISVATVKRHAISIYRKLGAKNRRDAVLKAVREGTLVLK